MAEKTATATATGVIAKQPSYYYGYIVIVAPSGAVTIDNSTAGGGAAIDVIPAATAAGTRGVLPVPVRASSGLYATFAGTGTILFVFD